MSLMWYDIGLKCEEYSLFVYKILEHKEYILAAVKKAVIQSLSPYAFDL